MKTLRNNTIKLLASVFYSGYSPVAPGTAGSLVAFIFFWFIPNDLRVFILLLFAGTMVSITISDLAEEIWQRKDDGRIVIDEFIGSGFALFLLPKTIFWYVFAFILFRLFDVIKPFGIRTFQNLKGGLGIVVDDVLAGILTGFILFTVNLFFT